MLMFHGELAQVFPDLPLRWNLQCSSNIPRSKWSAILHGSALSSVFIPEVQHLSPVIPCICIYLYIYIDTVYVCFMILSYLKLLSHIFTTYSSHIPPCILCTYMYIHVYICIYIYMYICIYIYIHPSIHLSIHPSIHPVHTCVHAYMHTSLYILCSSIYI